jgi:hypothetical protein
MSIQNKQLVFKIDTENIGMERDFKKNRRALPL